MKVLKKLLIALIIIIAIVAVAVIGGYIYVRSTYGIDLFNTIGQLNTLNQPVDEGVLCPNAFSDEDMTAVQTQVNSSVEDLISYSETDGYSVKLENVAELMSQDIRLTDKQVGALAQTILEQETGGKIDVGGKQIAIELKQVSFSQLSGGNVVLSTVVKLDITAIKAELNGFPFNYLKKYIPDNLYITSTATVVKGGEAFTYTTENSSIMLNNLTAANTEDLIHTLDVVLKIGTAEQLNGQIVDTFLNALIGSETNRGFAYSLKSIGATDYAFISENNRIYFAVTK
ncbi:MAG: hypothetical protein ACI4QI_08230 [Candidatus Coproplasma sp.]